MPELVEIADSFTVRCDAPAPPISSQINTQVDAIWADARQKRPSLFDGQALCVATISEFEMQCFFIPYRFIYSGLLKFTAAAVSGVVLCEDKIFFGKRSSSVTAEQGKLELVPSGGLTSEDYRDQVLLELEEEIYVKRAQVQSIRPFAYVRDDTHRVIDICCALTLVGSPRQVLSNFKPNEYSSLHCLTLNELSAKVHVRRELWGTASALMIEYLERKSCKVFC